MCIFQYRSMEYRWANAQIINPESSFRRLLDMPPSLTGKSTVTVAIAVDQVIHEPGGRELGLTFGTASQISVVVPVLVLKV